MNKAKDGHAEMLLKTIRRNVERFRIESNFTREDLAEKAGMSVDKLNKIEKGETDISVRDLFAIASVLSISWESLLSNSKA